MKNNLHNFFRSVWPFHQCSIILFFSWCSRLQHLNKAVVPSSLYNLFTLFIVFHLQSLTPPYLFESKCRVLIAFGRGSLGKYNYLFDHKNSFWTIEKKWWNLHALLLPLSCSVVVSSPVENSPARVQIQVASIKPPC